MGLVLVYFGTMRLYSNLDVEVTYQNFGSAWLGVMRGATENIELCFNGLFNLCATSGEHQYQDHLQTISLFWTERKAMRRFFFNRYYLPRFTSRKDVGNGKLVRDAMRHAWAQLELMTSTSHEAFLDFDNQFMPETYGNGMITAERPDADMKDAILANAFREKESVARKVVDTD